MTLFHYLHGNFQLTGWGVFWGLVFLGGIGGASVSRG